MNLILQAVKSLFRKVENHIAKVESRIEEVNMTHSDWNQNDSTQSNFIKNRPFYEEINVTDISGTSYTISGLTYQEPTKVLDNPIPLELGQVWGVTRMHYSGNWTSCINYEVQKANDDTLFLGAPVDEDSNTTSFYLTSNELVVDKRVIQQGYGTFKFTCVSGVATSKVVKQIDEKYLPSGLYSTISSIQTEMSENREMSEVAIRDAEEAMTIALSNEIIQLFVQNRTEDGVGTVRDRNVPLGNGRLYYLIPLITLSSKVAASLKIDGVVYPIFVRLPENDRPLDISTIRANPEYAMRVFKLGVNTLLQYDSSIRGFVSLSSYRFKGYASTEVAEVGQTVCVSAVDENGVPTAWEAVEFIDETAREGVRKLSEEKVVGTAIGEKCAEFAALMNNSENVESFIFFTDPHLAENDNYEEQMRSYLKTLKTYYDATPTSFVVCGGDWIGNSDTQKEACFKLGFIDGQMRSRFDKYYPVLGNHDTNYQGVTEEGASAHSGTLTNETVHNLMFRENGGLYYSFNAQNTKFYVLDSGTDWDNTMTNYRWEQVEWLANQLLQDDAQHIAVVVHMMFSSGNLFGMAGYILSVFRAYNDRSSLTIDNGTVFDFSAATGRIEFVISGHTHEDKVMVVNEIPVVVTTNMRNGNTPTFDLCMADYTNRKLHMVRVGSGENRTVELYSKEDALVLLLGMNLTGPKLYNNVKYRSVYLQRKKPEGVTKAVSWSSASTGDYPYNEPYYPIEVPDGAKRAIVTCPDYVKWAVVSWTKGKWDGENAATEDSGWLTVGGGTYEFAAETEVLIILFNDNNGNDMSVESYDSSSFSLAFGK